MEHRATDTNGAAAFSLRDVMDAGVDTLRKSGWQPQLALAAFLIVVSFYNYLLFHTLAEAFSIVIGVLMCLTAWQTHAFSRNHFLMYLANGYFWVALLDLVHTLIYKGMHIYPMAEANPATQFWIATRCFEALLLLSAPLFLTRGVGRHGSFLAFGALAAMLYALIMSGSFPDAYIEGQGLTSFKVASEYLVITLLAAAFFHIWHRRHLLEAETVSLMGMAILLTIGSELAFTFYINVYDFSNLAGHIFKLFSFWLIFIAIVRINLIRPYTLLQDEVRRRRDAEEALRRGNEELERRVMERTASLRKSEQLLEATGQTAKVGGWELDAETDTLHWTRQTFRIHDLPDGRQPPLDEALNFYPPEEREKVSEAVRRAIEFGEPYDLVVRFVTAKGNRLWTRAICRPVRKDGKTVKLVGAFQDITELKQTEEALMQAKVAAETANRAKSTFLANMSHELRTPLNAIIGFAQILRYSPLMPEEYKELVQNIHKGGRYLLTLINDILDLAKVEAGRIELFPEQVTVETFFQEVVAMFRFRAEQKGVAFDYQAEAPLPYSIHIDPNRLRQVVINLLGNAVKFTKQGHVSLSVDYSDARLHIRVTDTGPGIAPEQHEEIFKPFSQTGDKQSQLQGTGLGLSITRKIVELMGGGIRLDSCPCEGSCFYVEIPVAAVFETASVQQTEASVGREIIGYHRLSPSTSLEQSRRTRDKPDEPLRILIVDDIADNREILRRILQPLGFEIHEADSGEACLQLAPSRPPHLVLIDLRMSGLDGLETTRRLHTLAGLDNLPVIMVTACAYEEDKDVALAAGCVDYLKKPVERERLLRTIQQHLPLEWEYAQLEAPRTESVPSAFSEALALPAEWLAALEQAVIEGYQKKILKLLAQAGFQNAELDATLQTWAKGYEYQRILNWIEKNKQ